MFKVFILPTGISPASVYKLRPNNFQITTDFDAADIVQFNCGDDLSPELYGQANTGKSWNNYQLDLTEIGYWTRAISSGKKCVGICRGAQLINVLNGGSMVQHIEDGRHMGPHKLENGLEVYSDHHQLIVPSGTADVMDRSEHGDPEVLCFETDRLVNQLGFQFRPEAGSLESKNYFLDTILKEFS